MDVQPTAIPDVKIIRPKVFGDPRGFFLESWNHRDFALAGLHFAFVQDNHSRSVRGTLRGLHYQIRHRQGKLVRAATGTVFDVAVDLRRGSSTFGRWVGEKLSDEGHEMLWVPPGFAHGFLVLSDTADFQYKCTDFYAPEYERTIRWNDPDLGIDWPLPDGMEPLLSVKDRQGSEFRDARHFP
jgi:dTDP-4-dehydrorhamnose 3,5-epimerase